MTAFRPVQPLETFRFDERVMRVSSAPDGGILAIATASGKILLVEPGRKPLREWTRVATPLRSACFDPRGTRFGLIDGQGIARILDVGSGQPVCALNNRHLLDLHFIHGGQSILAVSRVPGREQLLVQLLDGMDGSTLDEQTLDDPFGDSSAMLFPHPGQGVCALWLAAGQDGQATFWVSASGSRLTLERLKGLKDTTPPAFSQDGQRLVVLNRKNRLALLSFPDCRSLGKPLESPVSGNLDPEMDAGDEDDPWAESHCFVSGGDDRVLARTNNGRIFLVALQQGRTLLEVAIEGHEPRPAHEIYPRLKTDELCTDLSFFSTLGKNRIVSIHHGGELRKRRDTVLIWEVPTP